MHVVPAGYGIICKLCDYEGEKKETRPKLQIDMTLFKHFLYRALRLVVTCISENVFKSSADYMTGSHVNFIMA